MKGGISETFKDMWIEPLPPQTTTDFILEAFGLFAVKQTDDRVRSYFRIDRLPTTYC